jgi:dTDP-4-amino-4,6-dideoxygalactose transaminase
LRRENAARYNERLRHADVLIPGAEGAGSHVFHQYTVRLKNRAKVQAALAAEGIASAIYYPVPLHRQEVFAGACAGVCLPVTERIAAEVLSLPMYPELTEAQIDLVCRTLLAAL